MPRPAWAAWGQGRAAVRSVALATSRWAPSVSVSLLPMGHRHLGGPCHHKLNGVRIWTEQRKEGWNVTWARAEESCQDVSNIESGVLHVGYCPGSQVSDPSLPSLKMWTSVRQRCVQERTSSARTPRAVTVVSVPRATNRLRASV